MRAPRWFLVRRSPRAVELEVRARLAGRFCCLSVCSWFKWEERRRYLSVLLIWRERVVLLRRWPWGRACPRDRCNGRARVPSGGAK